MVPATLTGQDCLHCRNTISAVVSDAVAELLANMSHLLLQMSHNGHRILHLPVAPLAKKALLKSEFLS